MKILNSNINKRKNLFNIILFNNPSAFYNFLQNFNKFQFHKCRSNFFICKPLFNKHLNIFECGLLISILSFTLHHPVFYRLLNTVLLSILCLFFRIGLGFITDRYLFFRAYAYYFLLICLFLAILSL